MIFYRQFVIEMCFVPHAPVCYVKIAIAYLEGLYFLYIRGFQFSKLAPNLLQTDVKRKCKTSKFDPPGVFEGPNMLVPSIFDQSNYPTAQTYSKLARFALSFLGCKFGVSMKTETLY